MDNLVSFNSEFWDTSIGEVKFQFGGRNHDLSVDVLGFGGRNTLWRSKYVKKYLETSYVPNLQSENSQLV